MKYHTLVLGCQMNYSDSERVRTVLEHMGFTWTGREEEASLLGIVACSVRQKAIDKVYTRIHKWNRWKDKKNLISFLTGCILPADKKKFLKLFDLVFTIEELPELENMIRQYGVTSPMSVHPPESERPELKPEQGGSLKEEGAFKLVELVRQNKTLNQEALILDPAGTPHRDIRSFWRIEPHYESGFEAFVPIQNGCDKFCTFCAVPYTRGREVSRLSGEIINEVRTLVEQGYKSITLLGQNVNSYGLDKRGNEISFPELLRRIGELGAQMGQEFWLYFTSPHPRDMTDEVIKMIARYPCLAKQVHLPVQSGDDKVLIRMNRKHSIQKYREIVHSIRRLIPRATLFTDIIVGFTGESEEQFRNTLDLMDEFKYNMAYIAQYSPRPGAASSRWADDVPASVKKERFHRLNDKLQEHSYAYNQSLIGKTLKVLVTGKARKGFYLTGHTEGRIVVRFPHTDRSLIGRFADLKITSAAELSIEGELAGIAERKEAVSS